MCLESIDYPVELEEYFELANHRRLHVRPLRRCEEGPIRDLYARLSPRTRYLRFFSPMPVLPDSLVAQLASVDYRRQLALIAEIENGGTAEVVGLASFGAVDDRNVEVALVVRDDWQRLRVGTELAKRVMMAAETRGFHRFIVHFLTENVAIRRLLKNVGEVVSASMSGGTSELAFVRRAW